MKKLSIILCLISYNADKNESQEKSPSVKLNINKSNTIPVALTVDYLGNST